ncbi:MAG: CHASE domain-containing protein [Dechloromonas sp.]|nr:CHASE domain-containing protein [Dechloromonas sp.]
MPARLKSLLLVALPYFLLATAGLLLAIPVGFASPVFPAAGLALAVALTQGNAVLPAIWLGSLAANLVQLALHGLLDPSSALMAGGIGLGAAAQAAVGRWAVLRFLEQRWRHLETEVDIIRFLLLGGPLVCWISALVGISFLGARGVIPEAELFNAGWNWFVGDTLGVFIATPLSLLYLLRHDMVWRERRHLLMALILTVLLLISAAFIAVSRWEQAQMREHINLHAEEIRNAIQQRFDQQAEALSAIRRLIEVSPKFDLKQFNHMAQLTLRDHPDIAALSFNPWVYAADRTAFEQRMSAQLRPKRYQITEQLPDRSFIPAGLRPVYVPIGFIAPMDRNWPALGFDIHADPLRRKAIDRALQTGKPAVTESLQLVQESGQHVGVMLLQPVFNLALGEPAGYEMPDLRGFAVAVLKLDQIIQMATWKTLPDDMSLRIEDPDAPEGKQAVFTSAVDTDWVSKMAWNGSLHLADRQLQMTLLPNSAYLLSHRPWVAWATGVLGLLIASLLQVLILQATGRTSQIRRQVELQTLAIKHQREELESLLAEHRSLIDHLPVGIFKLQTTPDQQIHFHFVSALWCQQLAVDESVVLNDPSLALQCLRLEDQQVLRNSFYPATGQPQAFSCQLQVDTASGRRVLNVEATPTLLADGEVLWEGTQADVTRLHTAEFQQRLLSSAVAQSWTSIVVTDADGKIVFVNAAFERQTGYTFDEVKGKTPRLIKSGETPLQTYQTLWRDILSGKTWTGELHNRKKSGELYWEWANISPVRDERGRITHFLGIKENITERKRQQQALNEAKQVAEAASLEKSRFLATMSHEIRTPMNGILGMAQMLMMPAVNEAERQEYAAVIMSSGQTLLTLLNDILDLSRVEAGKLALHPVAVRPADILQEQVSLFSQPAADKGLQLAAEWHGPVASDYALDPVRLRQMISNLLSNAIKFTEQGYVHLDANEVRRGQDWAELSFSVTDSGIGIAPEQQHRLFQTFSQLDASATRKHGGSGLGLSIVRKMAEAMSGRFGVESTPGQGARFWFTVRSGLPSAVGSLDPAAALPAQAVAHSAGEPAVSLRPVLVVEDDRVNQAVLCRMLKKLGLDAVCVDDGQAACERIEAGEAFSAVLMDCQMPVMDGYQATARIRAWERAQGQPRRPLIAVTANAYEQDQEHCAAVGMDDFLPKPIDFASLQAALGRWLPGSLQLPPLVEKALVTPVDRATLLAALRQLRVLLADNQFDAVRQLQDTQHMLAAIDLPDALQRVSVALNNLDFQAAERALLELAVLQNWEI